MATQKQKDEFLLETKQINALKMKRNRYAPNSANKKAIQGIIDVAEKAHEAKRLRYGI